jgi:hypothetical protein
VILYYFLLNIPFVPLDFKAMLLGHPIIYFTVLAVPIISYIVVKIIFWLSDKTVKASLIVDFSGLKFETKKRTLELQWFKMKEIHLDEVCRLETIDGIKWINFKDPLERFRAYKLIKQELKILDLEHLIK